MTYVRPALALLCFSLCASCAQETNTASIDAVLEAGVADGRIPGVIAMVADSDGVIYQRVVGKRSTSTDNDMTMDTIVRIASMTKAITSVAVMQLVERGKFELDTPAANFLSFIGDAQVLNGFDADDNPILRAPSTPVTIRHLLSHTSGYVYEIWNEKAAKYVEQGRVESMMTGGDGFFAVPLMSDPGSKWEYGISTDILGKLIEAVTGQTLDDYFRAHIFVPLGMSDTYFNVPDGKVARIAPLFSRSPDGLLTESPVSNTRTSSFSGGGGLSSTANDYIRFMRTLLNGGELDGVRILNAESIALMAQNHIGELEAANSIKSLMPTLSNDFSVFPHSVDKFGLGFLINTEPVPGGRPAGSLMWAGIYNTYFWIDGENDLCAVLMTQILPFYDGDVIQLLQQFEAAVYSSLN
jgi:CubicO group peptidase (beta-lactamase class C family)